MRKRMCKRKGFTMVELMVVVIIMAVLGLAVMPSLMGSSEKAKYSRAWNDLNAIANAFTAFYGREGNLPKTTGTSAVDLDGTTYSDNEKTLFQSFLGTPLEGLYDPWGARYKINSTWNPTTGQGYIVVYVGTPAGESGVKTAEANFGSVKVTARVDIYNGDRPMAKLVVNVM